MHAIKMNRVLFYDCKFLNWQLDFKGSQLNNKPVIL